MSSPDPAPPDTRLTPADWPRAIADVDGPQLVVAGPGTGKSEFLVRRAAHLIDEGGVDPDAILTLTFSRRAAADLRERILTRLDRTVSGVPASTFHSFASRVLEVHAPAQLGWQDLPAILTGPEQIDLVAALLGEEDPSAWPVAFRPLLTSRTFASEVTDFILRARERLLDPASLAELAEIADDWRALPGFVRRYDQALAEAHRIDYGTLQQQAVTLLSRPEVARAVADQYRYVIVDEYQDTSVAQAELLAALTLPHRNILAAADPYQSVYGFRGTELHNVAAFPDRFRDLDGHPARRLVLTTSFRVPAEILRAAERVTAGGRLPGAAGPIEPAAHPGRVDVHVFDQHSQEADWIAAEARRLHIEHDIPYLRMAVLVRTKRRLLPELSRALERRAIPHDPPHARLTDHAAVQMLFDIVRAAAALADLRSVPAAHPSAGVIEAELDRRIRRIALGPLLSMGVTDQRALARARIRDDAEWPAVLATEVPAARHIAELIDDPTWLDRPAADGFWHLWTEIPQIRVLATSTAHAEHRAAWTSFSQVLDRLRERSPETTLLDYVRRADADDIEAEPLLGHRTRGGADRLTLTTLHQSKGLEFDVVFIADAVEGVFPDLRRRTTLLGTERLSGRSGDVGDIVRRQLQEEMRLAYTAMTRARTRVVWTATSAGIDETQLRPSRFLAMVGGVEDAATLGPPDSADLAPVTIGEAEAHLRSVLTDPRQPAHRRLAALAVLANPPVDGLRTADQYTLVRDRGDNRGILPDALRLSPSQAEAYATCPRRYALERRLRLAELTSPYASFGSLIHEVLEDAETDALVEGDRHSTREEAQAALDRHFSKYPLGDGAWQEAWRRRAEDLLDRLYADWPQPGAVPVILERKLELDIDGVAWIGYADRIESDEGGLRVVDYKTSKSVPTKAEAESSLQLGFYMLAAGADPDITRNGEVVAAEYWYPLGRTVRVPFDPGKLDDVRARLVEISARIASEDWDPVPNERCDGCAVRLVCPEWPDGREAYVR